jgi:hypothetical protein
MSIDKKLQGGCAERLYAEMSNSMSPKPERHDDGKKLSGSSTLSFSSRHTWHGVIAFDELVGFVQSGSEFTCVLPANTLPIEPAWSHLGFTCGACDDRRSVLHFDFWEQGDRCRLTSKRHCHIILQESPFSWKNPSLMGRNSQVRLERGK